MDCCFVCLFFYLTVWGGWGGGGRQSRELQIANLQLNQFHNYFKLVTEHYGQNWEKKNSLQNTEGLKLCCLFICSAHKPLFVEGQLLIRVLLNIEITNIKLQSEFH